MLCSLDFVWQKAILVSKITHQPTLTAASTITLKIRCLHSGNLPFRIPNTIGYTVMRVTGVEDNILEGLYCTLYNLLLGLGLRSLHQTYTYLKTYLSK